MKIQVRVINLSNLREAGASIKGIENASSGVIPVMKLLEDSFSYANQLGQRNGAGAVYLNIFHPDVVSFLSTKKENADEKIRVKTLSLGLVVPDKFYELVEKNETMYLFSPLDVEREYGVSFSYVDITQEYDNMVSNDNIKKYKISARELENEISKLQQESGYPYILNSDVANNHHQLDGQIIMSNLCSEILQVQVPSEINDEQQYDEVGIDISCNLGSLNIDNAIKSKDFEKTIETSIRALTNVSLISKTPEVPTVQNGNDKMHAVGLGAMSLHAVLAKNKIEYGSPESLEFVDVFFSTVRYYALKASNKIAMEKNESFYGFEKSNYANGKFFDQYITGKLRFKGFASSKVEKMFSHINIPTEKDWHELKQSVMKHGLFNGYLLAVAP